MNPSLTSHIVRSIERTVSNSRLTRDDGVLSIAFPAFDSNFRENYMLYNLSRKLLLDTNPDERISRAFDKFLETETQCKRNKESILWDLDRVSARVLLRAQQITADVLGELDLSDWWKYCEFTGGASTSRSRAEASPAFKYDTSIVPDVTPLALPYLLSWLAGADEAYVTFLGYNHLLNDGLSSDRAQRPFYRVVPGGRMNFVPKDWDIDRVTLSEPDWNMFLQKGVGVYIRKRLKSLTPIDLTDQTRNQRLAFAGSLSGSLGTIDLSSASDTISMGFVKLLVPADWFEVLYCLRSPTYVKDGEYHTLHKMCSMGNGYTFELESLLFYALTQAVVDVLSPCDKRVAVYGDDIIAASSVCGYLQFILEKCGFAVNTKKSYWGAIPFRESCGRHFMHGVDCSPVYVKHELSDPIYLQQFLNQFARWASYPYDPRYAGLIDEIANRLPSSYRNQIPVEEGDQGGLHHPDLCHELVRHTCDKRRNLRKPNYGSSLSYSIWTERVSDLTDRVNTWTQWVYFHMTGSVLTLSRNSGGRLTKIRKWVSTARGAP